VTERPLVPVLPDGMDAEGYTRLRRLMRLSVQRVWRSDQVIAGMDPWTIVDEAWASMAEGGFSSAGPFEPFALRVARNKAIDAIDRAEVRRRYRSLDEPIGEETDGVVLGDTVVGSRGAEEDFFDEVENTKKVRQLALAEDAINNVLSEAERYAFREVIENRKSRAAVGRELDPPVTGQRVGQIVAAAVTKIRTYIGDHEGSDD
jgi:DNA-directed RNA polymerase specialized sigma24 family protein